MRIEITRDKLAIRDELETIVMRGTEIGTLEHMVRHVGWV